MKLIGRGITKRYGGVTALDDVDVEIRSGEVRSLMGENGAGKSTLARILSGCETLDAGHIKLNGERLSIDGPLHAQKLGIAIIHQELDLFPSLSVAENIVIANLRFPEGLGVNRGKLAEFCTPFLERVGLHIDAHIPLSSLPIGKQQLVAIARALSMQCGILFMDEPSSALPDEAAEDLFRIVEQLRDEGVGIVYVSHKMDEIFRLSDTITVLRDGRWAADLEAAKTDRAELIEKMVGRSVDLTTRTERGDFGEVLIEADSLSTHKLRDVSFAVRRGEVLGIAGLVGAGRSELGAALVGIDTILGGDLMLDGASYSPGGPADAQKRGVVLLPEDRKLQGLMLQMPVQENAALAILPELAGGGIVKGAQERDALAPIAERLALKCAHPSLPVSTLSGGNQQKVLLARWLLTKPEVIFLDDPTRGVDVGAKEDIYEIVDELAANGKAVLMASSELPELLRCADRILVLNEGRVAGMFDAANVTQEQIMTAATHSEEAQAA